VGALERLGMGRGVLPHREKAWGGGCAFSPENFWIFGVTMTCFDAFWYYF